MEDLQPEALFYQPKYVVWVKLGKSWLELVAVKVNKQADKMWTSGTFYGGLKVQIAQK